MERAGEEGETRGPVPRTALPAPVTTAGDGRRPAKMGASANAGAG